MTDKEKIDILLEFFNKISKEKITLINYNTFELSTGTMKCENYSASIFFLKTLIQSELEEF